MEDGGDRKEDVCKSRHGVCDRLKSRAGAYRAPSPGERTPVTTPRRGRAEERRYSAFFVFRWICTSALGRARPRFSLTTGTTVNTPRRQR